MSGRARVAVWSADWRRETHGQALVTRRVVAALAGQVDWREAVYRGGAAGIPSVIRAKLRLWRAILLGVRTVYMVTSRSTPGFLRDLPAFLASFAGCRVVAHAHGSDLIGLLAERWVSPLARALYRRCEVVVPSEHLVAPLGDLGIARVRVCENFAELPAPGGGGLGDGAFTVLWNSNVIASKGIFRLAEAMAELHAEGLPVRLRVLGFVLGDAEMSAEAARARLRALASEPWFDHVGPVPAEAALAELDRAEAVALPSHYPSECQPLAVIQAMCRGLPVILADTPALRATAGEYPAVFVSEPMVPALAEALRALAGSRPDLGAAAEEARARFSAGRFDREMAALLRS